MQPNAMWNNNNMEHQTLDETLYGEKGSKQERMKRGGKSSRNAYKDT